MQNVEKDIESMKTAQNELLEKLNALEKRIALWTGGILAIGYIIDHLLKFVK